MLHQCGHRSNTAHPCPCGFPCGAGGYGGTSAFSFFIPAVSSGKQYIDDVFDSGYNSGASSSSVVDCTLSLGTPSTRQTEKKSLCGWDALSRSKKNHSALGCAASSGGDPHLLARRCANCDTSSTPLWRNGPRGPKSLCNACGIRYKKEERRAAAVSPSSSMLSAAASYHRQQTTPWSCYSSSAAAVTRNGGSAVYDDAGADDGDASYLSWRLNVVPSTHFSVGYN